MIYVAERMRREGLEGCMEKCVELDRVKCKARELPNHTASQKVANNLYTCAMY